MKVAILLYPFFAELRGLYDFDTPQWNKREAVLPLAVE